MCRPGPFGTAAVTRFGVFWVAKITARRNVPFLWGLWTSPCSHRDCYKRHAAACVGETLSVSFKCQVAPQRGVRSDLNLDCKYCLCRDLSLLISLVTTALELSGRVILASNNSRMLKRHRIPMKM